MTLREELEAKMGATPAPTQLQDIEQYRMQMAAISTAALGYWKKGDDIHPDYVTPALHDVADLYAKYDELFKQKAEQPAQQDIPGLIAGALGVSRGTAYDMMREALAEQPAQQEPVGTVRELFTQAAWEKLDVRGSTKVYLAATPQAQQEPVAWGVIASNTGRICQVALDADEVEGHNPKHIVPLYTTPQPPAQPLTDAQIFDLAEPFGAFEYGDAQGHKRLAFARAIEAAHGITKGNT